MKSSDGDTIIGNPEADHAEGSGSDRAVRRPATRQAVVTEVTSFRGLPSTAIMCS